MTLPQTTQFINSILAKISAYNTPAQGTESELHQTQTQHHGHPRLAHSQPASPFPASSSNLKPLMLTLHCIFPNEFLLALDILDRGLVRRVRTRYRTGHGEEDESYEQSENSTNQSEWSDPRERREDFFFVTSASTAQNTSRSSFPATQSEDHHHMHQQKKWQDKGYEVRLQAWNCTCPSFTISAFRGLGPEPSSPPSSSSSEDNGDLDDNDDNDKPASNPTGIPSDSINSDTPSADADVSAYSFGGTLPLHPESAPPVCKHILACLLAALCPDLSGSGDGAQRFANLDEEEVAALCAGWGG
ncbi:hypothetical protein BDV18DRAFT_167368 [Aspergillus unguis]